MNFTKSILEVLHDYLEEVSYQVALFDHQCFANLKQLGEQVELIPLQS